VEDVREVKEVIALIQALKNFNSYENFAYHISLLRQFVSLHTRNTRGGGSGKVGDSEDKQVSSVHGQNVWSSLRKKRGLGGSTHGGYDPDSSGKSQSSHKSMAGGGMGGGMRRITSATGALSSMAR